MKKGAFTFVLHSHLPYCRLAGRWPHGEEWLHEGISETYLPLLNALYDLHEEGCPFKLTLGITPVLAEQLADPLVLEHCHTFIKDKIERAAADRERFQKQSQEHLAYLAGFYLDHYRSLLHSFEDRFQGNLIAAFKRLQDMEHVEILTSAATHAYLPLLERDSSIYGQLKVGIETYRRHFGQSPQAIWLPECAYRPAFYTSKDTQSYLKPGIEQFLAGLKLGLFFAETHTVEGGEPVGKATGAAIGPYGGLPKRHMVPHSQYREPTLKTTYLPYWVQSPEVAVLGRNNRTGMQVWSAEWGYPGDCDYREFHKKDSVSGLQYWRITGAKLDLAYKEYYHPDCASYKTMEHATHYSWLASQLLDDFYRQNGKFGIIAAAYDTELLGHWWFEGILWLKEVLRQLASSEIVELTTASQFLQKHPPEDVLALPEGSWGLGGNHYTWLNADTEWMWPRISAAELRMEELVAQHPSAPPMLTDILNHAARELLLLESSDWPFLITTKQAGEYAYNRFLEHLYRFNRLAEVAATNQVDEATYQWCLEIFERDNLFPDIDYHLFANREQYQKLHVRST